MRTIDNAAIKAHADRRFRSEYDYALFEYYRSAKVLSFLEQSGVRPHGDVLDAGCGGGGMPLSLAEEAARVVGIDLIDRFRDAGTRLARDKGLDNLAFLQADGTSLPFAPASFDCVLSHAVIEHVADAERYLVQCRRVLRPGGWMYLSTAPYLSFAGAHLPRLKVPVPLHLIVGRKVAFATFVQLARHATWTLREPADENSFIKAARRNAVKHDDLLELVRVRRLRGQIARAGFTIVREQLHLTSTFRNLPGPIPRWLRDSALTQDVVIGNMEYILAEVRGCTVHGVHEFVRGCTVHGVHEFVRGCTVRGVHSSCNGARRSKCRAERFVCPMQITRYQPADRDAIDALYRRVFGPDAAEASRLRWDWRSRLNPHSPPDGPLIWVAREGPSIIGQYATMPVALSLAGREIDGSWGMDVMVAPERQRQGLGELLFGTWDQHVGAALGLGLSASSHRLFQKLRWPEVGPVPYLVKPLTRRAFRRAQWPMVFNRLVSAVTLPYVRFVARTRPLSGEVRLIRRFGPDFDTLWRRVAPEFDLAVRRDARYLQWKYVSTPHVRYTMAALVRDDVAQGYIVYRHAREPRGRVTLVVDFLVQPGDEAGLETLLRWVDREARAADSDKVRCFCMHAGFRKVLKREGYAQTASTLQFVAKINRGPLRSDFYTATDRWHVTLGDSDQDR